MFYKFFWNTVHSCLVTVGREVTVALSTKSLRKCFHIQKDASWAGNSLGISLETNGHLLFMLVDNWCDEIIIVPGPWTKAFLRESACHTIYKSTGFCWIVSLTPHTEKSWYIIWYWRPCHCKSFRRYSESNSLVSSKTLLFAASALESQFDWCCFYYFLRNSLVALLEALFAQWVLPATTVISRTREEREWGARETSMWAWTSCQSRVNVCVRVSASVCVYVCTGVQVCTRMYARECTRLCMYALCACVCVCVNAGACVYKYNNILTSTPRTKTPRHHSLARMSLRSSRTECPAKFRGAWTATSFLQYSAHTLHVSLSPDVSPMSAHVTEQKHFGPIQRQSSEYCPLKFHFFITSICSTHFGFMIANVRGALFYHITLSLYYSGGGCQQAYSRNYANAEWKKSDVGRVKTMIEDLRPWTDN